jgi:gamma-glutamyltranspeptidase
MRRRRGARLGQRDGAGAVPGWVALSERFGKLPFADLLEPAIEIAERGYARAGGGAAEVGRRPRPPTSRASPG